MELFFYKKKVLDLNFEDLLKLNLETPGFQRIIDNQKIRTIEEKQLDFLKKFNTLQLTNFLSICYCDEKNKYYLIDGQHRYKALDFLHKTYKNQFSFEDISCIFYYSKKYSDVKYIFDDVNKSTPQPDDMILLEDSEKQMIYKVITILSEKYPKCLSVETKQVYRPSMTKNKLEEALKHIITKIDIVDANKLLELIYAQNDSIKNSIDRNKYNVTKNMFDKALESKFYLGLYPYLPEEDYKYEWVRLLVINNSDYKYDKKIKKTKHKISKSVKIKCWNKYIGESTAKAYCIVCNNNFITQGNFEGGHIISHKNGGSIDEDNILPICSLCNKSMSSQNMGEYININYPKNYNFQNRKYNIPNRFW